MGDMGDMFKDWKELKKIKKKENAERILNLLTEHSIPFKEINSMYHLVMMLNNRRCEVWPTTDTMRKGKEYIANAHSFIKKELIRGK